jgi:hypothetical protein
LHSVFWQRTDGRRLRLLVRARAMLEQLERADP